MDLDGARDGVGVNEPVVKGIIDNISIPVQLGGGIRDSKTIKKFLDYGVGQVIIGTRAIKDREWMKEMIRIYGDSIVLSIDAIKGYLATDGWRKVSDVKALDLIIELEQSGLRRIVYTDIEKDGMLKGPNFKIYQDLASQSSIEIIASGGITTLEDIRRLKDMGIYGAIIGKALYNGDLVLKEVLKCQ